ncbi:RIP metalloprotease RseP [Candidatus Vondammii sp. HM_W22]|uniref:RIP metalloprotease RseP n=1 Tax=Candidatus Vondammii sp. HM_W22 TaxID=2687299 RepID=UPI001F139401|nr:RIP metalloprotease RseP [Candidatus Vondammii sp. HM_W22]
MNSLLFTIFSFILALGILITVHEFGHFWVARKLGVKVLRFSVGFGKPLLTFRGRGPTPEDQGTEYVLAAIPLGGYVKMLDEREGAVPEKELERSFNRKSLPVRAAIVAAGPVFNFIFAILAFWLINVAGDMGARPLVGAVAEGSIAAEAGFQPGDEFVSVADRITTTWEMVVYGLLTESASGDDLAVKVRVADGYEEDRQLPGGQLIELAENSRLLERIGLTPKRPQVPPVIDQLAPGEAAERAGIQSGDRILAINGKPLEVWDELVEAIKVLPGKPATLEIERQGATETIGLIVGSREVDGKMIGRIGAGPHVPEDLFDQYRVEVRYGPVEAIGLATAKTWDMSVFMLKMLGQMLKGEVSVKNLSGPISIAQTAGKTASYGAIQFLKFLALVSISLGVLNLLPIPVLDGGHLLFFLVEAVKGSPLSEAAQAQGQRIGMALLLALMGLAFYVDLARLLG